MIRIKPAHYFSLLLATVLLTLTGCDNSYKEVTGTVTCDGVPLATGRIIFVPETGRQVIGQIVDGSIVDVTTNEPGGGALVGLYRIAVFAYVREPVGMEIVPSVIKVKYNDPETSGLEAVVNERGPNDFTFDLEPR